MGKYFNTSLGQNVPTEEDVNAFFSPLMKIQISQSTIDEMRAMAEANREYYRLFVDRDDNPCVVCLQPFDEDGYDQKRFINEERYETEEEAEDALTAIKVKAGMPLSNLERLKLAQKEMEEG